MAKRARVNSARVLESSAYGHALLTKNEVQNVMETIPVSRRRSERQAPEMGTDSHVNDMSLRYVFGLHGAYHGKEK